jgi:hypothetical protein
MSNNFNGLLTTKQVAGSANVEESCYFVLNTDPVIVDTLSANEVVANTVVSGVVEVNTNIDLNGGILTVSGGVLEVNGTPVGGGAPDTWSQYPAIQDVDVAGYELLGVEYINAKLISSSPVIITNPFNLGQALTTSALVVQGGDYRTDISQNGVGITTSKRITRGTIDYGTGEIMGTFSTYGPDTTGTQIQYAAVRGICTNPTAGSSTGRINFAVNSGASYPVLMQIDASLNEVSIQGNANTTLNMRGQRIKNAKTISTQDISNASGGLVISAPYQIGVSDPCLTVEGGDFRTDNSNNAVHFNIKKNIRGGGTFEGEGIGQINFFGLDSSGTNRQMGWIIANASDTTTGAIDSRLFFNVRNNSVAERLLVLDGSNNVVSVESHRITNLSTPVDISDAATKGYVDTAAGVIPTLAQVLTAGNSAGTNNIDMFGNSITSVASVTNVGGDLDITADDINLNCQGLTSILNITSVLGTQLTSGGAINITAGGVTAINSTGNVSIGSLGTTSIENFNLNNSVLTKVAATSDLELNNIQSIQNIGNNLDVTAGTLQLTANTVSGGTGQLSLIATNIINITADDIASYSFGDTTIDASGNITINSSGGVTRVENFSMTNSTLSKASGTTDLSLNNIATINNAANGVSMVGATTIRTRDISGANAGLIVTAPFQLGISDACFTIEGGDNRTDVSNNGVNMNIRKKIRKGDTESIGQINFFGVNSSATQSHMGLINCTAQSSVVGSTKTSMGFRVVNNNAIKIYVLIDGSGDVVSLENNRIANLATPVDISDATTKGYVDIAAGSIPTLDSVLSTSNNAGFNNIDMNFNNIENVLGIGNIGGTTDIVADDITIQSQAILGSIILNSASDIRLQAATQVSISGDTVITSGAANPTSLLLQNNESGPSANILQIYKNSTTPAVNDFVGNLQFAGNTTTGVKHVYGSIQTAILNPTNGAEDGELRLRTAVNGTITDFVHIDGSNSLVSVNPNALPINFNVEDTSGRNLIFADASNQNVMFRNYPQRYILDICGDYTINLPNGFNTVRILAYGAGGGGASGRFAANTAFGGGAGGGGAGAECWFDRRELFGDASDNLVLWVRVGQGGAGGAPQTVINTNGNNGGNGGRSEVRLNGPAGYSLFRTTNEGLQGGFGGSGGTNAAGAGGNGGATQQGDFSSTGTNGGSSKITGAADNVNPVMIYRGTLYMQTGGSGGGGGISVGGTAYNGAYASRPAGDKWFNGLNNQLIWGLAGNTGEATNGGIFTFGANGLSASNPAIPRPLVGSTDRTGGGGACVFASSTLGGGNGGSIGPAGTAGSRGSGGGGGGASAFIQSGGGGRGCDGFVYITVW